MKIFLFAGRFAPLFGGMESQADAFIKYFSASDSIHLSGVCTFAPDVFAASTTRVAGVPEPVFMAPVVYLSKESRHDTVEVLNALEKFAPQDGDVIFFNDTFWVASIPMIRRQFPRVRIAMYTGGNDISEGRVPLAAEVSLAKRQQFTVDIINTCVDWLFVCNQYCVDRQVEIGVSAGKMIPVPGGVDTNLFYPASLDEKKILREQLHIKTDAFVIVSVARLVRFKGFPTLFEALALLSKKYSLQHLVIGSGLDADEIQCLASPTITTFLGGMPTNKTVPYYRAADLYSHTPITYYSQGFGGQYLDTETMGRVFCEAAASGIPVVSTTVGGVPETVSDGVTGLLAKEGDVVGVANAIERCVTDIRLRAALGSNARARAVKDFSWEKLFAEYVKVMQS